VIAGLRACLFDVFGTVVDWRSSICRELEAFGREKRLEGVDWLQFTLDWRALYQPSMEEVRSARRPWTLLDDLHRESLVKLLGRYGVGALTDGEIEHLNSAWHRLDPWPDAVEGLTRLKRKYVIATCSNGNIALMVDMAKRAGLPWDCILGAETARAYKPLPEAYRASCRQLGVRPEQALMVAAHNSDLAAAKAQGLMTAFVPRPTEYGPGQASDLVPGSAVDVAAGSFVALAARLGC
jgi:2-haloacid dehalogenase